MQRTVSVILALVFITSALSPALVTSGAAQGPTVEWRVKLPARTGVGEPTAPLVTDLDGDGKGEIVLTSGNTLYILRLTGTTKWLYTVTGNFTGAAVADIDGNTEKEIVAVTDTGAVHAFSRDGSHLWVYETGEPIEVAPLIADVNLDGQLEIVVGTIYGSLTYIDEHGKELNSIKSPGAPIHYPISFAKCYGSNEILPVLFFTSGGTLYTKVGLGSSTIGGYLLPGEKSATSGLALGNLDEDHQLDIVVPLAGKATVISTGRASPQWNVTFTSNSNVLAPVLADLNSDGNLEIIVGNGDGDILEYSSVGTAGWVAHIEGGLAGLSAMKAPGPSILAFSKTGVLVLIDAKGAKVWSKNIGIAADQPAIIADVDSDSEAEILVVGTSGDLVLLNTHQILLADWSMAGHDLANTRNLETASTGQSPWEAKWDYPGIMDRPALVADVDADGKDEVFIIENKLLINLLRGNGRIITNQTLNNPCDIDPVAADINNDGGKEIILATSADVQARSKQLTLIWNRSLNATTALAAGDINADGKSEVFAVNGTGHILALRPMDGVPLWSADLGAKGLSLAFAALSPDGQMDLVATDDNNIMYVLNATSGNLLWSSKVLKGTPNPPAIGDFNGDGRLDVAISSKGGDVLAYSGNGTELWEILAPTAPMGIIAIDGNATGQDLALFVNSTNNVLFIDGSTGKTLSMAVSGETGQESPQMLVAAFMGTSDKVAVMSDLSQKVLWAGRSDTSLQTFDSGVSSKVLEFGDLDGDGLVDAVFTGGQAPGGTLAYSLAIGPGATVPWSMVGHDPERTYDPFAKNGRIYPDLTLSAQDISFDPMVLNGDATVNVTITYRNQGPLASGPFNITLYQDSLFFKTLKVPSVAPFSEDHTTYKWAAGKDNTTLTVELDGDKVVSELREDNNKASRPIFKNLNPIAEAGPNLRAQPDKPVIFDGGASKDPDGDIVSYFWDFDDGTNATGVVASHAFHNGGSFNVMLQVTDEYGAIARDTVTIMVNHAPDITNWNPKNNPTVNEGEQLDMWVITSDADGDKVSDTWFLDGKQVAQGQSLSYWANYSSSGAHKVMVVCSDGNLSANRTWNLTVVESTRLIQDTAPLTPVTIFVGQSQAFEVVLSQVAAGSIVTWFLDGHPIIDGPKEIGLYANEGTEGQHVLKVQVQDDTAWDFYEWAVTIGPRHDIPSIRWVYPTNLLVETTFLTPVYFGISAQGGTYQWYINGIAQVAQNGPSFRFDTWGNGSYNISVRVSSDTASVSRNWTVTINYPPIASIDASDLIVKPGKKVTLNADKSKAYKAGDSIVSYKWDFGDGSTDTGPLVKHAYKTAGGYKATVMVTDTRGLTSNATVTIVVEPKDQASTPGFEVPLMFAALGVAIVAVLRRKKR